MQVYENDENKWNVNIIGRKNVNSRNDYVTHSNMVSEKIYLIRIENFNIQEQNSQNHT